MKLIKMCFNETCRKAGKCSQLFDVFLIHNSFKQRICYPYLFTVLLEFGANKNNIYCNGPHKITESAVDMSPDIEI